MTDSKENKEKKKGFWARIMDGLDKKMESVAKGSGCCCSSSNSSKSDDKKCC